jgi:hypothetical protein
MPIYVNKKDAKAMKNSLETGRVGDVGWGAAPVDKGDLSGPAEAAKQQEKDEAEANYKKQGRSSLLKKMQPQMPKAKKQAAAEEEPATDKAPSDVDQDDEDLWKD